MILMMCVTLQMCFFSTQFLWTFPSISSFSHVQSSEFCLFCVIDHSLLERMEGESKSFIESKFILCFECNKHFSSPSSSSDPRIRMTKHIPRFILLHPILTLSRPTTTFIRSFIHEKKKVRKRVYIVSNRNVRFLYSTGSKLILFRPSKIKQLGRWVFSNEVMHPSKFTHPFSQRQSVNPDSRIIH